MTAVVAPRYGSPDVLTVTEVPRPTPEADEVLIEVRASTVGPADSAFREGRPLPVRIFGGLRRPKAIPGDVFAGAVAEIGPDVTMFAEGDLVMGTTAPETGAHAEYVCLSEDDAVTIKPANMSEAEAAAVCDGALTALAFLQDTASLGPGDSILINGASGSIGTAAVQLAKHFGATVTGVCSTRNVALVESLGADAVIDYTATDFTRTGERYDVIFDAVGKSSYARCRDSLRPGGRYMTTVPSAATILWMAWTRFVGDRRALFAATGLRSASKKRTDLRLLRTLCENGTLEPVIDSRYSLAEIAEAHRYVDTGRKRGSAIITMD